MSPEQREFELRDYVAIVLRRKWWGVLVLLVVVGSAAAYTLSLEPFYRAVARVVVRIDFRPPEEIGQTGLAPLVEAQNVETQLEILRSASLLQAAETEAAKVVKLGTVTGVAVEQVKKTNIVTIGVTSTSPETTAAVANALAEAYIDRSRDLNRRATDQALQTVDEQMKLAQGGLDESEAVMQAFGERAGLLGTEGTGSGATDRPASLEDELRRASSDLHALDAEAALVDAYRRQTSPTVVARRQQAPNPTAQALREKLLALELQRLQLADDYAPGSHRLKQMDATIDALRQRLSGEADQVASGEVTVANPRLEQLDEQRHELAALRAAAQARQAALAAALHAEMARLSALPARQQEYRRLARHAKVSEEAYTDLLAKQQELLIAHGSKVANAALLTPAAVPRVPAGPRLMRNLAVAAAVGLLLGLVVLVLVDYMDDTIREPRDAEKLLGQPVIGTIGYAATLARRRVTEAGAASPVAEAFRVLRSNLKFSAADQPLQTVLVTSAGVGEGKSMVSAHLAVAAADAGHRVVVIDADLRRPALHRWFGVGNEIGLTNVLIGEVPLDEALLSVAAPGVFLLASGPPPPTPVELLESAAMARLLTELRERADLVVLDSAPLLAGADSQLLSSKVDGALMVLEAATTRSDDATHALVLLERARARVLGLVFNKMKRRPGGP